MKPESFDEQLSRFDLMCEGDPTFDLSDNDIAALLAVRTEMRIMARSTLASQERIKGVEAKLAALDWTPITESNLPNRGDEALMLPTETHGAKVIPVGFDAREGDAPRYIDAGYTHFRPINPPVQP